MTYLEDIRSRIVCFVRSKSCCVELCRCSDLRRSLHHSMPSRELLSWDPMVLLHEVVLKDTCMSLQCSR